MSELNGKKDYHWLARYWLPALLGLIVFTVGFFIDSSQWASWFKHPARNPMPQSTLDGILFLRIMLFVAAISICILPAIMIRLDKKTPSAGISMSAIPSRELWLVVIILLAGTAIRMTRLTESLWYDEITAYFSYGRHGVGAIIGNYFDPSNHVFHTLLSSLSFELLNGITAVEIAYRIPALLFSLGSIVFMYCIGQTLGGIRMAIIAACIATLIPVSVLEGAEARGYSMMICMSAAAIWFFMIASRDQRAWQWALYAICCAVGVWAHFLTAFVPVGHAAFLLWKVIKTRSINEVAGGFVAILLAGIISITLYAPIIPDFFNLLNNQQVFASSSGNQPSILGTEGLHALFQLGGSWYWWATLPGLVLCIYGLIVSTLKHELRVAVCLSLLCLPLMLFAVSIAGSWMYARFTFFALPAGMLLIAIAIDHIWKRKEIFAYCAITLLAAAYITDLAIRPAKQPLRDAVQYVTENQKPFDTVVAIGLFHGVIGFYAPLDLPFTIVSHASDDVETTIEKLQPRWVIVYYPRELSVEKAAFLKSNNYNRVEVFPGWVDWGGGDVWVYRK